MFSITILLLGYVLLALTWPLYYWFEVKPANMLLLVSAVVNLIALGAANKAIFKPEDKPNNKAQVPTPVYVMAIFQLIGITLIMGVDWWLLLHDHETARWIICVTILLPAFVYVFIRSAPIETRLMVFCLAVLICFSIFGTDDPFEFIKPILVAVDKYLSSCIGVPSGFFSERGRAWLHLLVIPILYLLTDWPAKAAGIETAKESLALDWALLLVGFVAVWAGIAVGLASIATASAGFADDLARIVAASADVDPASAGIAEHWARIATRWTEIGPASARAADAMAAIGPASGQIVDTSATVVNAAKDASFEAGASAAIMVLANHFFLLKPRKMEGMTIISYFRRIAQLMSRRARSESGNES